MLTLSGDVELVVNGDESAGHRSGSNRVELGAVRVFGYLGGFSHEKELWVMWGPQLDEALRIAALAFLLTCRSLSGFGY